MAADGGRTTHRPRACHLVVVIVVIVAVVHAALVCAFLARHKNTSGSGAGQAAMLRRGLSVAAIGGSSEAGP